MPVRWYIEGVMNNSINTTNPETTTINTPKTRGRTKGVSDSVLISVGELARRFGNEGMVPVRRTWLVEQGAKEAAARALAGTVAIPSVPRSAPAAESAPAVEEKIAVNVS